MRQINIDLISKIKKKSDSNRFVNGLLKILQIILYPVIVVGGLLYLLIIIIFGLIQNMFGAKTKNDKIEREVIADRYADKWTILTEINGFKIFQKYKGEVRFGPAYLSLKSEPTLAGFNDCIYGDWFFQYQNGIFLQKWNSIKIPDTDLVFIDIETKEIKTIMTNISSVLWDIVETDNGILQLNCDSGKEIMTYKIDIKKAAANTRS
jgi:hypothetical protein